MGGREGLNMGGTERWRPTWWMSEEEEYEEAREGEREWEAPTAGLPRGPEWQKLIISDNDWQRSLHLRLSAASQRLPPLATVGTMRSRGIVGDALDWQLPPGETRGVGTVGRRRGKKGERGSVGGGGIEGRGGWQGQRGTEERGRLGA